MSTRLEDEVRGALWRTTESLPMPSDPYAQVMGAVEEHRRRRRTLLRGAGLVAALLAGVVGVSTGALDASIRTSLPASEQQVSRTDWGSYADWPVRGSAADDAAFVTEFDRLYGRADRLLFVEDTDSGRVAVAISADREAALFIGAVGAAPAELQRIPGREARREIAVAVPHADGHLLIVVMPEYANEAAIALPTVARDGSLGHTWEQIPVTDGVGRAVVSDPIAVARVGTAIGEDPIHVIVGGEAPGTLTCDPCDSEWFARDGVARFKEQAAAVVRVDPAEVTADVLLDVPVSDDRVVPGGQGRLVALGATLPSGGLLRATYLVTPADGSDGPTIVEPLRPLPAGDESRPVVFPATGNGSAGEAVILAPGTSRIGFTALHDGAPLADVTTTDGVAVVSTSSAGLREYRLTTYGLDGSPVGTWHGGSLRWSDPWQTLPVWTGRTD